MEDRLGIFCRTPSWKEDNGARARNALRGIQQDVR